MSRRSSDLDPAFDPVAERLVDVGRQLRETRQQRGEDLYDVADYLRIKPAYLFALEEGDLAALPGRTYALGFLHTYADHLGFDGAEVVRGLKAAARTPRGTTLKVPEPAPENRLPSLGVVVAALVLAGVAYGGWFAAQSGDEVLARIKAVPGEIGQYAASMFDDEAVASVDADAGGNALDALVASPDATTSPAAGAALAGLQAREAPAAATGTGRTATPPTARTAAPGTDLTAAVAAAPSDRRVPPAAATEATEAGDGLAGLALDAEAERDAALRRLDNERPDGGTVGELLAALQPEAAGAGAAVDAATPAPVVSETGRVVLLARETSWIQVQSPSRDFLRSTTLEPGQRFELPDRSDLALWTGNAGGVEIWVDGRNVGVLGRSGAVMRDVSLAPDALLARR